MGKQGKLEREGGRKKERSCGHGEREEKEYGTVKDQEKQGSHRKKDTKVGEEIRESRLF